MSDTSTKKKTGPDSRMMFAVLAALIALIVAVGFVVFGGDSGSDGDSVDTQTKTATQDTEEMVVISGELPDEEFELPEFTAGLSELADPLQERYEGSFEQWRNELEADRANGFISDDAELSERYKTFADSCYAIRSADCLQMAQEQYETFDSLYQAELDAYITEVVSS